MKKFTVKYRTQNSALVMWGWSDWYSQEIEANDEKECRKKFEEWAADHYGYSPQDPMKIGDLLIDGYIV